LFDDNVSLVVGDGGMEVEGILPLTIGEKLQQLVDDAVQKYNA
jgi:hypothetical protein